MQAAGASYPLHCRPLPSIDATTPPDGCFVEIPVTPRGVHLRRAGGKDAFVIVSMVARDGGSCSKLRVVRPPAGRRSAIVRRRAPGR